MPALPESGTTVASSRLVLVEGKDEVNLFSTMIKRWSIGGLQVLDVVGKTNFRPRLDATLANARAQNVRLSAIGIVRDADDNPTGAFESIANTLQTFELPVPQPSGLFATGFPSIGVFILPDGHSPGSVEEVCWEAVSNTAAGHCCMSFLDCLRVSMALLSPNVGKTLVHAYLAAQEDPSTTVGVGALKGYWGFDHSAFRGIREFLERLAII